MVFETATPLELMSNDDKSVDYPLFPKTTSITFNSGNIVSSSRIKRLMQSHHDSEINESIHSTITSLLPSINSTDSQLKEQKEVICRHPEYYEKIDLNERNDVSISVKLFLNTLDPLVLDKALETILEELNVSFIETLIISFPDQIFSSSTELQRDLVEPIWSKLEHYLDTKLIINVGTSDLNKNLLEQLCNLIGDKRYLPHLNQVNLASCCRMPEDLKDYAKSLNIQLTTHNDSKDILSADSLQATLRTCAHEYDAYGWIPLWIARYTIIVKNRGIVKSKGYLINAQRELKYTK